MPRDPIRRWRASFGSSARFVRTVRPHGSSAAGTRLGDRPPVGRPSSYRTAGAAAIIFSAWAWPREIQGRPDHRRDGLILREEPQVFLRLRECDSGKIRSKPSGNGNRTVFQRDYFRKGGQRSQRPRDLEQEETEITETGAFFCCLCGLLFNGTRRMR
jgi:hypothetical protein